MIYWWFYNFSCLDFSEGNTKEKNSIFTNNVQYYKLYFFSLSLVKNQQHKLKYSYYSTCTKKKEEKHN